MRGFRFVLILSACVAALAACNNGGQPQGQQTEAPVKLPPVSPVPAPTLPAWISSISPTSKDAQSLAQVRVIFAKPVARVEALEGDGPADVLSHVKMEPELHGHFVLITPKMIGFVADQALPLATRVKVTLTAGLKDLDGDALASDLAWTFETSGIDIGNVPNAQPTDDNPQQTDPVSLHPTITVHSNVQLDVQSLGDHVKLTANGQSVAMNAAPHATPTPFEGRTPDPGATAIGAFDPSTQQWYYDLQPRNDLATGTKYSIDISPGIEPAIGNIASTQSISGNVHTYDALALQATPTPGPTPGGRFSGGDPVIEFNNPMDEKSIDANISVSPAPAQVKQLFLVNDNDVSINPYALDPNATYAVTVGANVKDTFGQTLGQSKTVTVKTGDFAPGAWAPTGVSSLPAGGTVSVNFYGTNVPGNKFTYAVAPMSPTLLLQTNDASSALPGLGAWQTKTLNAPRNKQSVVPIPLPGQFGIFEYGIKTPLASDPMYGTVSLTNLGVHAQIYPQSATVMTQHLSDGAPAAGVGIAVYRVSGNDDPVQCATGRTGSDGTFSLSQSDLARCYADSTTEAPELGFVATEGADVAVLRLDSYDGAFLFDTDSAWFGGTPIAEGTIFSDRTMYQPGESAEFTGVAYYAQNGVIHADRNASYDVTLTDPNNKAVSLGTVKTDAYATFSVPYTFAAQQALGYYTVSAKGSNGVTLSGQVRVAEFKPPNFKLDVALDKDSALAGSSVAASATGAYLFGSPLQGGKAHATVTRDIDYPQPKGWDDYTFGRHWFWPEKEPSVTSNVLEKDYTLDRDGKTAFSVDVPADIVAPLTYTVNVDATDVSNLSVSNSQTFTALPEDGIIGVSSDYVGTAGKPMDFKVVVTDVNGKAIAGKSVHLVLQKMTYTSAAQGAEGGSEADASVKYDDVGSTDVTSADTPVSAQLTPADAASYRVVANFAGAKSEASSTDVQIFAAGANEADFGGENQSTVKVSLDKKTYKVGDTATAVVASPFDTCDAYVAVVRSGVLYKTTVNAIKGAPRITFRVTPDMVPNAALEVVLVRRGAPLSSVKPGALSALEKVGVASFTIDTTERYAKLTITPAQTKAAPGAQQQVAFSVDGPARAHAKVVAMVVNDAILQLSGYRLPDLVQTVYSTQPIQTRFGDSRDTIKLQTDTPPAAKGFGYGGGFLGAAADTRIRRNFQPLAYYGSAITDANGHASMSFKLPDDLTTWRVMAVVVGNDDAHFGTSDATFIAALPVLTNPLLPQIARPGDTFNGGESILTTNGGGTATIDAKLTGAIHFASGDPSNAQGTQQAGDAMAAFRLPMVAGTPAPSTVSFVTHVNGASDAFNVPIVIRERGITESVIQSGVTATQAAIPVDLSSGGTVTLTLSNSAVPQVLAPADRMLEDTDEDSSSDEAASRLVSAAALAKLAGPYRITLRTPPQAQIDSALRTLLASQKSDGGFGYFAGSKASDPFASAYVLDAMGFARGHGVAVPADAMARAQGFAATGLANPSRWDWCKGQCVNALRFEMLDALASAGDRRTDFLQSIYDARNSLDSATQIRLARYLLATPGWHDTGASLAQHLRESTYLTGRYTVANQPQAWSWFNTLPEAQAEMLQLLVAVQAPADQIDGAVRQLVAQECKCGWPTLGDTAAALRGITAYAATENVTNNTSATVTAGGKTIATASFSGGAQSQTQTLDASKVGANSISIDAKGGRVHYTLVYTYPVAKDAPGALAAFRVTRTLREVGSDTALATMDLAPVKDPVTVDAGHVYDVGVRIAVDHSVNDLLIDDAVPAGFEPVDTTLATENPALPDRSSSWQIDSQQIYADRVTAYASQLYPGIYELHYLVRSVTPGTYSWPGGQAYLMHAPEQFGRTAAATLVVK